MTNWSKLTVAKLKDECSERAIPLTGLKLKQHFIDKLEEWEAGQRDGETNDRDDEEENANGEVEEVQPEPTPAEVDDKPEHPNTDHVNGHKEEGQQTPDTDNEAAEAQADPSNEQPALQQLPETETQPLVPGPSQDAEPAAPGVPEEDQSGQAAVEDKEITRDEDQANEIAPQPTPAKGEGRKPSEDAVNEDAQMEGQDSADQTIASASVPLPATHDSTRSSSVVPAVEVSEDARKRKRRSVTPTPQAEEIAAKKAKANDGSPLIRAQVEAEKDQAAIDAAGVDADAGPLAHQQPAADSQLDSGPQVSSELPRDAGSVSPIDERTVAPASHPATSTLYIRNFKRPLRQPDLQAHLASLAKSSGDDPDTNPIKFFYLDVLRTHAFVRLHSISAASRVRCAIHDTRWPDEPTRDLLWADFIPDDRAEIWANQEADASAGSGFGSRGSGGKRWEVNYQEGPDGIEAILQDANETRAVPQPRQPSFAQDRKPSAAWERELAPGVHPDRAALVPSNDLRISSRRLDDRPPSVRQPKNAEKSFAALDELFSSTEKTKPKLYYKPVASQVIEERMELIQDLRVGHNGMGRSGDDGMKRYTFEWEGGKQEWVDKGPEFGFGRKGQERLAGGRGRGGGGYRGRGGGGFGYPRGGGGAGEGGRGGGRGGGDRYMDLDAPPSARRGGDGWRGGY